MELRHDFHAFEIVSCTNLYINNILPIRQKINEMLSKLCSMYIRALKNRPLRDRKSLTKAFCCPFLFVFGSSRPEASLVPLYIIYLKLSCFICHFFFLFYLSLKFIPPSSRLINAYIYHDIIRFLLIVIRSGVARGGIGGTCPPRQNLYALNFQ